MARIVRKSGWRYQGSAATGVSVEFVSAATGTITVKSPAGVDVSLRYTSAGVGPSVGIKNILGSLPKVDKIPDVNVSQPMQGLPDVGTVYILDNFKGNELAFDDFEGLFVTLDSSIALGAVPSFSFSGTAMYVGVPLKSAAGSVLREKLISTLLGPALSAGRTIFQLFSGDVTSVDYFRVADAAKALVLMGGMSVTALPGAGATLSYGALRASVSGQSPTIDVKTDPEETGMTVHGVSSDTTLIRIPADVLFCFDEDIVRRKFDWMLGLIGLFLETVRPTAIDIEGHTDGIGGSRSAHNWDLSMRRALAVQTWFARKHFKLRGVRSKGFAGTRPIEVEKLPNDRDNPEARSKNRRVEIRVTK